MPACNNPADVQAFGSDSSLIIESENPYGRQSTPQLRDTLLLLPYVSLPFRSHPNEHSRIPHDLPAWTQTPLQEVQSDVRLSQTSYDSHLSQLISAAQQLSDVAFTDIQKDHVCGHENIIDFENDSDTLHGSDMPFSQEESICFRKTTRIWTAPHPCAKKTCWSPRTSCNPYSPCALFSPTLSNFYRMEASFANISGV